MQLTSEQKLTFAKSSVQLEVISTLMLWALEFAVPLIVLPVHFVSER